MLMVFTVSICIIQTHNFIETNNKKINGLILRHYGIFQVSQISEKNTVTLGIERCTDSHIRINKVHFQGK